MPPLHLHWRLLGRPVKPVSLALLLTMITIGVINIIDEGVLTDAFEADVLSGWCLGVSTMFVSAWAINSRTLERGALIGAFMAWFFRGALVLLLSPHSVEAWIMSFLWAMVAAGAYLLERFRADALEVQ